MAFPTTVSPWPTRRQSPYTTRWGSGRPARPPSRKELGTLWKFAPSLQVFRSLPSPSLQRPRTSQPGGLRVPRRPSTAGRGQSPRTFPAPRGEGGAAAPAGVSPDSQSGRRGRSRRGGEGRAHGRAPAPPPCCSAGCSGSGLGGSCCRNTPPRGAKDRGPPQPRLQPGIWAARPAPEPRTRLGALGGERGAVCSGAGARGGGERVQSGRNRGLCVCVRASVPVFVRVFPSPRRM